VAAFHPGQLVPGPSVGGGRVGTQSTRGRWRCHPRAVAVSADTARQRHLSQVFRDDAEEASTTASDLTLVLGRSAAATSALAAAQGPSVRSASAVETAAAGNGSETHVGSSCGAGRAGVAPALAVAATRTGRSPRSRSRHVAAAPTPRDGARREQRRRRPSRRGKSPSSSGPSSSTES